MNVLRKAVALCLLVIALPAVSNEYALIVNTENGYDASMAEAKVMVRLLYMKKKTQWQPGVDAIPLAPPADSLAYQAFIEQILGMKESELDRHWLKQRQINGTTRPRAVSSESVRARLVARKAGAFSIVSKTFVDKKLPKNTRVIFYFSR